LSNVNIYTAAQVAARLPYKGLISELRRAFSEDIQAPLRAMHPIGLTSGSQATLAVMPAWCVGESLVTKLVTIFPDNSSQGLPTIHAQIVVFNANTGIPTAVVDGTEVTRRRTAATSALAATYLAREHAEFLLVVGTGAQAIHQALAHAVVRPINRVGIWGRSPAKARSVVESLKQTTQEFSVHVVENLEAAARDADVISCATSACYPVVFGEWLKPGCFLDLVGSHTPDHRECDDEAVRRSRIYVDTLVGTRGEAGDLLLPLKRGVIQQCDVLGDLRALCRGEVIGRSTSDEITLFKSVGSALEDLAAARMVVGTRGETT
jgi:alanine dehydrogenase